jgi:CSLREA domain-containing protein
MLLPAALVLLVAAALASTAQATKLTVTTTADELTSQDGLCSLREAVATVNAPGAATDCGRASSTSNTIVLPAGHYVLSIAPTGADDDSSGDLNVTGTTPFTVSGGGATSTVIDATGLGDRVLSVAAGATVTLEGLTITGGHAPDGAAGTGGTGHGSGGAGSGGASGGGILNLGSLTLAQVAVSGNRAGAGGSGGAGRSGLIFGGGGGAGGAGGAGGGIYTTGTLTLNDVAMSHNSAGPGGAGGRGGNAQAAVHFPCIGGTGGPGGTGGVGGSIYNTGNAATLTLTDSTISGSASGSGGQGGNGGSATRPFPESGSAIGGGGGAGGSGGAGGGGVANLTGTVVVTASTISSNAAGSGGGGGAGGHGSSGPGSGGPGGLGSAGGAISSDGGSLSVTNSTLYSNSAGRGGGPDGNGGDGGAVDVTNGASSLLDVTADRNQAGAGVGGYPDGLGGGIYVQSANSGENMIVQNTIVAASRRGGNCAGSSPQTITDGGHDLSFPDTTCPGINADPKFLTFNDYGGPTETLGLAAGSPAIDQVPPTGAGCPATDQRGVQRPQGSACDIGAFEFATPQITITTPADGASYPLNLTKLAAYQCSEGAGTTTIATCNGTVANGQPIDTSSTGTKSFTVTATDKAGNTSTETTQYTVS